MTTKLAGLVLLHFELRLWGVLVVEATGPIPTCDATAIGRAIRRWEWICSGAVARKMNGGAIMVDIPPARNRVGESSDSTFRKTYKVQA